MLLRFLSSVLLAVLAAPVVADTVWLRNGDRLTGEIILLDGGKLALKTRYAGQVLIAWKDIDTLRSDQPMLVRRQGFESEHSERLEAAGQGMVRLVNGSSQTIALGSINRLVPPRAVLSDRVIEGNLDAKLDMKRDSSETDEWKVKGNTRVEHGRWRHVLSGELERKVKNDVKTADNWQLEYDLDRFIDEHWFWRAGAGHDEDEFAFLNRQRTLGTGPGYRFWDTELGRFDMIAQLNRVQLRSAEGELSFNTYGLEWDYKRLLWGTRLELYSTAELQLPDIEEVDYVFDAEAGLRYRVNEWARLSLLYELDAARGLGQSTSERRYLLGIGVGW